VQTLQTELLVANFLGSVDFRSFSRQQLIENNFTWPETCWPFCGRRREHKETSSADAAWEHGQLSTDLAPGNYILSIRAQSIPLPTRATALNCRNFVHKCAFYYTPLRWARFRIQGPGCWILNPECRLFRVLHSSVPDASSVHLTVAKHLFIYTLLSECQGCHMAIPVNIKIDDICVMN